GEKQARVGELDEEMVYESRVGDVFLLGSSSWQIEDITHDRVLVTPAPGVPGKMPFWHGDAPGRPLELGRALGAFLREMNALSDDDATARARAAGLDELAARNLVAYLGDQRRATGVLPDDRTIVVERFRDELGDWRVCIHSPFGADVNAPWAFAVAARIRESLGLEVQTMHTDDGIVIRLPDADAPPDLAAVVLEPDEVEAAVQAEVGGSALFASRFRECAARALLLPRRTPGRRAPLWQQRQRSAVLLQVAAQFGSFPIVLETMRECLQDVFDVPGLRELMADVAARRVRLVEVETALPSPFAQSLLFGYIGAFMYDGDAPLAERRAQALSLDSALLAELLGQAELRELVDADALAELERELQRLTPERHARDADDVADLLRWLGALSTAEALERGATPQWLAELEETRRALRVRIAGEERWIAVEDAGRFRDALGTALPVGVPEVFTEPVPDPVGDLVARHARTHGPFTPGDVATRLGVGAAVVADALARLGATGRVVHGEFRPDGSGLEWCDAEVLRAIRRRSLARLRKEVEPVAGDVLARFLPVWQGVGTHAARGVDGLLRVVEQLAGVAVPASVLERQVLAARVVDYAPGMLDELTATGEVLWVGSGSLGSADGWLALYPADAAELMLPPLDGELSFGPLAAPVVDALHGGGALFFRSLAERVASADDADLLAALWELVWAGVVTNDTLAPLRALTGTRRRTRASPPRFARSRRPVLTTRSGPAAGAGRWSLVPGREDALSGATATEPAADTRRRHALAELLLDRHGVVTRGVAPTERIAGGFAAVYPVLKAFEESGRCRRGYFVESLGGAQFAVPGAVDRMRALSDRRDEDVAALVLAATDPANAYGAALPWPERGEADGGHRPGRKAGALVVTVHGRLVLYVEKGGRTLLTFSDDPADLQPAVDALALAVRDGLLGRVQVERADGASVHYDTPLARALEVAGFRPTPRGLRLRA
ncbi:MAG: DEAD/DEAH box helicase, partial [Mycobacteriales bacterium]